MFLLTPVLVFMLVLQIKTRHSSNNTVDIFYLLGEQHGFRQAKNIKFSLDGEFYFYSRVFDFDAPGINKDVSQFTVIRFQGNNIPACHKFHHFEVYLHFTSKDELLVLHTLRLIKNTLPCVTVFLTLQFVFQNVMIHCLSCLIHT